MSHFKTLYGYEAPLISLDLAPSNKVEVVDELLREREIRFDTTIQGSLITSSKSDEVVC
jgi:hypothetical protein